MSALANAATTQGSSFRSQGHLDPTNSIGLQDTGPSASLRVSQDEDLYELPLLLPLSHAHPLLSSSAAWDVDAFLLSRSNLSLQDLRSELRGYLAELKEELVQLINDDYAAFISLSTDLKGEGARLERLQKPLSNLKVEIEKSRGELSGVQEAVQAKLGERAGLREEKALLHLLLKLSDSVLRLESLLLIASSDQGAQTSVDFSNLGIRGMDGLSMTMGDEDTKDDRSRGGQAKHLARVATEYTQLLYHAEKAREENCAFVKEVQWRVDRIKMTLSRDLDHLFSNTLTSLTSSSIEAASVTDKARWTSDLTECLRTYDVLHSWRDAEEVVRRDLVRPFVKNTIFSGALNVAPSPVLVRTLLPGRPGLMSPRTPYTPYAGVRANPFDTMTVDALPQLTEEEDDPLAGLFNTVLRFVQINCTGVMELAEKISSKSRKSGRKAGNLLHLNDSPMIGRDSIEALGVNEYGFSIIANVIWAEIGRSVMEELGPVVFSAGNPDEFQKNYTTTNNFVTTLEQLAPSLHAVEMMREHPIYVAFQRRWQLPVYFQLRWKDIVGKLEDTLANPASHRGSLEEDFVSPQASAFYVAIQTCWSAHVFIPELAHRFWRLTLQLLSRYRSWLESALPPREYAASTNPAGGDKAPPAGSGFTGRSAAGTAEGSSSSAADDIALQRFANAFIDIAAMDYRVMDLWTSEIGMLLPEGMLEDDVKNPEEVLKISLEDLTVLLPDLAAQIIIILTRRCSESLSEVPRIRTQYHVMNNKKDPTGPSAFVPLILRPIKDFFEQPGITDFSQEKDRQDWATQVFDTVATRYTSHLIAMQKTEDSLRRMRKGKMFALPLFGGGASRENEEGKDAERIRMQIVLDVDALGEDAKRLGVDVDASEAYTTLKSTASSPPE